MGTRSSRFNECALASNCNTQYSGCPRYLAACGHWLKCDGTGWPFWHFRSLVRYRYYEQTSDNSVARSQRGVTFPTMFDEYVSSLIMMQTGSKVFTGIREPSERRKQPQQDVPARGIAVHRADRRFGPLARGLHLWNGPAATVPSPAPRSSVPHSGSRSPQSSPNQGDAIAARLRVRK